MPEPDDAWTSYQRTEVEIMRPGEGSLRVRPAPQADEAAWPWPDERPVHLLTAWDPGRDRPGHDINRVRQAALEADLAQLAVRLLAAVGIDPVTRRREEGVAVQGLPEAEVLALGVRYGQDAAFAWTPDAWAVVDCRSGRRVSTGWSLQLFPAPISLQPGT